MGCSNIEKSAEDGDLKVLAAIDCSIEVAEEHSWCSMVDVFMVFEDSRQGFHLQECIVCFEESFINLGELVVRLEALSEGWNDWSMCQDACNSRFVFREVLNCHWGNWVYE